MNTFLLFLSLINFWLDMKTSDETNYLKVNYSKHFNEISFSLSEWFCYAAPEIEPKTASKFEDFRLIKNEIPLPQKDGYLKGGYLMFLLGVALTAIGIEFILNKKANAIKQHNVSLVVHHQVMQKRNSALNAKLKTLAKSTEKNKQIFQVMAHDLRSPVAAIVGLSSFMIDEQKLPPEDMEVIDLIHTSGQDSLKFINEILNQESALPLQKTTVSLKEFLTYCIAQLQITADEKQQQLILQGTDFQLNFDRSKIWRVLTNILSNAIKFSPPFSPIIVSINLVDQYAQVAITDQGIGIPNHLKNEIFSQNESRKREGTLGEQSFGMGLAIAKQYLEAHGGRLTFESEPGSGTTFFVNLPIT